MGAGFGDRLVVLEARMDDRLVAPRESVITLGDEEVITLVGDLPSEGTVRVIDAHSGEDLRRVDVVPWTCGHGDTELPVLEALDDGCVRSSASPIALPANPRRLAYWIGSPGYAWRRIRFGTSSGSPIYALSPGGELRVEVTTPRSASPPFLLRLERAIPDSARVQLLAEEALRAGAPLRFRGLPTGDLVARFVAQDALQGDYILAERKVTIAANAAAEVQLDLDALWEPLTFGDIALTLILEDESDAEALSVKSESIDTDVPHIELDRLQLLPRGPGDPFVWRERSLPAGRHRISVPPSEVTIELAVESGATAHASLVIPALPKLRLWVMDAATGSPVVPDAALWRTVDSTNRPDWNVAAPRAREGAIEFPVCLGRIEIGLQAGGYTSARAEVEISPGMTEDLIELHSVDPREIVVRLTSAGSSVPAPEETWRSASATDASGRSALLSVRAGEGAVPDGCCSDGASSILVVDGPGRYRVTVGRVPGFATPDPVTVVVDEQAVIVELELPVGPTTESE